MEAWAGKIGVRWSENACAQPEAAGTSSSPWWMKGGQEGEERGVFLSSRKQHRVQQEKHNYSHRNERGAMKGNGMLLNGALCRGRISALSLSLLRAAPHHPDRPGLPPAVRLHRGQQQLARGAQAGRTPLQAT